jgi:hypothetical protein
MDRSVVLVVAMFVLVGCGSGAAPSVSEPDVPNPRKYDTGETQRYMACTAEPRRALTERENCELAAFGRVCTPYTDCYVSCITSPDGSYFGGKCAHVCGFPLREGAGHPEGIEKCENLPGRSAAGLGA